MGIITRTCNDLGAFGNITVEAVADQNISADGADLIVDGVVLLIGDMVLICFCAIMKGLILFIPLYLYSTFIQFSIFIKLYFHGIGSSMLYKIIKYHEVESLYSLKFTLSIH